MSPSRHQPPALQGDISLVISDVDGTLITPDRRLTPRTIAVVARLADTGIGFTLISSRPPQGLSALVDALNLRLPLAAFNGGALLACDMSLLAAHRLSPETARQVLALLAARGVEPWVFTDQDWRLCKADGSHVEAERGASGLEPIVVEDFDGVITRIDKIVGVSDDHPLLAAVEAQAQTRFGTAATVQRSHPYYLDVTHRKANKGDGVEALCRRIGVELRHTAVIGDMFNDVAMFKRAGLAIAMGQAPADVQAAANAITGSNAEDGFALAVEQIIRARYARREA